jgi:hypothetical protein
MGFFSELAATIGDRLEQQTTDPKAATQAGDERPEMIEVTTVKMLAQLMADADTWDPKFGVYLLITLLPRAQHLDITVAIFEALLRILRSTEATGLEETILEALVKYGTPLAGWLNERKQLCEDDWQTAEEQGLLPEVEEAYNFLALE